MGEKFGVRVLLVHDTVCGRAGSFTRMLANTCVLAWARLCLQVHSVVAASYSKSDGRYQGQ